MGKTGKTRVCSRESSPPPNRTQRVRLLPSLLTEAPVAERSRHHRAKVDRWVRLPPGALTDGVVRKPAKRPGREPGVCGFDPHPRYSPVVSAGHWRAPPAVTRARKL